eukprot:TRINITY_DN2250_c0_g1_i3.p2 TRINITY_DN2250_c0_g1~~TRINITY_DN2250_c0_g1_i3.p2  ORF type:complete len:120 (-),score=32.24 TRINITY_DN2250_c0_g1_i3:386-745(-)
MCIRDRYQRRVRGTLTAPEMPREPGPGEMLLFCSIPREGCYTYTICCHPDDTVRSLKQQILDDDPIKTPIKGPERPRMDIEDMHLRTSTAGIMDDEATLKSYGILPGVLSKQWIEVLEI